MRISAVEREAYQVKLVAGMVIALADDDEMPLPTWDAVTIHVTHICIPTPKHTTYHCHPGRLHATNRLGRTV